MNFRLLSREAIVNNRRLSIVAADAGDAGARGIGRAAGVRVGRRVRRGVRRAERRRRWAGTRRAGRSGRRDCHRRRRIERCRRGARAGRDRRASAAATRLRRDAEGRAAAATAACVSPQGRRRSRGRGSGRRYSGRQGMSLGSSGTNRMTRLSSPTRRERSSWDRLPYPWGRGRPWVGDWPVAGRAQPSTRTARAR